MTPNPTDIFDALANQEGAPDEMLAQAVDFLRAERRAMELFEAIKMQVRSRLGLPLISDPNDPLPNEQVERQLETGLLDACREVGAMLIDDGRVSEGWMYLRPLGDLDFARQKFGEIEINDDNYDEMIQVLLHEGVDVGRGYRAVLKQQGTCNGITLFEQAIVSRDKQDRQAAAAELLDHFYDELSDAVRHDIAHRDKENPQAQREDGSSQSLGEMVQTRPWLLGKDGYHLDTSHLAAVVRVSVVLQEPEQWKKARDLAMYGRKLSHQYQYPGNEPFVDFYPNYGVFFDILRGHQVDSGLKLFERKARSVDVGEHGPGAIETYVDLLDRLGRQPQAVQIAVELAPDEIPAQQIVPMLIDVATRSGDASTFEPIKNYCRKKEDVLGYVAVLHAQGTCSSSRS